MIKHRLCAVHRHYGDPDCMLLDPPFVFGLQHCRLSSARTACGAFCTFESVAVDSRPLSGLFGMQLQSGGMICQRVLLRLPPFHLMFTIIF